jgi:signal peptide peptidase SppA
MLIQRIMKAMGRPTPPIVPVVRLAGVIGPGSAFRPSINLASLAGVIERAFTVPDRAAVALVINSPGGSPVQSALVAGRIRQLAEERGVPVFAFAEDVAASGGYWLACAADEIYADEASIIGSIGVVSAGFGFQDLLNRLGVERRVHTSGERKAMLDPFRPEQPEDVARLKGIQGEIHDSFKAMVARRRGDRLKAPEQELFSGEFWTGRRALELGLVDGLGDIRSVMRARFGDKVRLRLVQGSRRLFQRRLFRTEAGSLPAAWAGEAAEGLISAVEERALWSRYGL